MLSLVRMDAHYGDSHILHGVSLEMGPNARVAILGRNGAGKTTLLKSIMNAGPTMTGTITWNGKSLDRMATHKRARAGLCLVPEDRRIVPHLTVLENLALGMRGASSKARRNASEAMLARFPMILPFKDRGGGLLSGGQQQVLALARAAMMRPRLLLLDEPTEGLAPVIVERLVTDVLSICQGQCGLLLSEQNIWFSRRCTERLVILDSGRVVFGGTWPDFDLQQESLTRHLAV